MHQEFFNAPINMIIEAALNNQFTGIPFINNSDTIRKYLTPSPATPKGRMKKPKACIRSTREKLKSGGAIKLGMEIEDSDSENETENTPTMPTPVIIPNDEPQANNIFCYAALAEKQQGTLYTDATGAFPEMSLDGKQYFLLHMITTPTIFLHSQLKMYKKKPSMKHSIRYSPN